MMIEFDSNLSRLYPHDNTFTENPYVCRITIIDDNAKEYKKEQKAGGFQKLLDKKMKWNYCLEHILRQKVMDMDYG